MAIPDFQSVMRPVLEALADGQARSLTQIHDFVVERFQLPPDEIREKLNSGRQTIIRNRVGWSRTYLNKAGLLEIPERGLSQITDRGREALEKCPERVDVKYLKQFPEFVEFHTAKPAEEKEMPASQEEQTESTPEEMMDWASNSINRALSSELLAAVKNASPSFFEQVVVDLMLAMGYGGSEKEAGQATQATSDDGIDGTIKEDKLGLDTIYLQAKRWQNTVHRPELDKFIGSLTRHRARKGVFITTSNFSDGARESVKGLDMKVVLIDGPQLAQLMIEYNLGVTSKRSYVIKHMDGDYFNEAG